MKLSVILLQIFLFFFAMFRQQTSTIKRTPYLHGIDEHRILVELEDYVSPEFIEYYFYRFGYNIERINIEPVQGVIIGFAEGGELTRISRHPFVQEISRKEYQFLDFFINPLVDKSRIMPEPFEETKITFEYYVSDEMIDAFRFQNQKLGIQLLPRAPKSVVLKPTKLPTRMMAELDLLIYVKESSEVIE